MIVTFRTEYSASVQMFGDIAVRLLKLMGNSGTVPGAILAKDVPEALNRLKQAIEADAARSPAPPEAKPPRDGEPPPVSLRNRALPLVQLLSDAARDETDVLWDK